MEQKTPEEQAEELLAKIMDKNLVDTLNKQFIERAILGEEVYQRKRQEVLNKMKKTMNIETNINEVVDYCHSQARDMGWHNKPREVGTLLCLVHSEISEAMEGARKDLQDDHLKDRKMFEVELADACIRIFDIAGLYNLDLGGAIKEKLIYNLNRADHQLVNREKEGGKKF